MAPKANARTRSKDVHVPAHPMVPGAPRPAISEARDLGEMRLQLRSWADEAVQEGELGEAAEFLLRLGSSLVSTQSFTAGLLVLDEALDTARASGERDVVDRVVVALERAMVSAR